LTQANTVIVAGLGEVGRPLRELLAGHYTVIGIDIAPPTEAVGNVDVLHVCYPFEIKDFIGETTRYIDRYKPALTIINSTVAVGTTRAVMERTGAAVAFSPVRGKHVRMLQELRSYTKFVGAIDPEIGRRAADHFAGAGLKTAVLGTPEAAELAKLTETTFFGVLIAWAQELERYCDRSGASYDDIVSFYEEIKFFPQTKYFPGVIGGHCVMPNIEILRKFDDSQLLRTLQASNRSKIEREEAKKASGQEADVTGSRR